MRKLLNILLFLISIHCIGKINQDSATNALSITISSASENGIFHEDQLVEVFVSVHNLSDSVATGTIHWKIETDEQVPLKSSTFPISIKAGQEIYSYCPIYEFSEPGFYKYSFTIATSNVEGSSGSMNVGYRPEKIRSKLTRQPDFDAFWKQALKELDNIDPKYKLTIQNRNDKDALTDLYFVEMISFGNVKITGWLEVPRKNGRYPGLLRVPGYLSNMKPLNQYDDMVIFSINPRGHGDSEEGPDPHLELWIRGLDDHNQYYYKGAYLDCLRALDFLASRSEVNPDKIAAWGGSQGGGFSFMTAALDDRVSYCVADIPWLCDWVNYFKTTHWDEIDTWLAGSSGKNWTSMLKTLGYFDTMNMADKIKCPVLMGIGLQDQVCPPATSFATYNLIQSKKEYLVYPKAGHGLDSKHWDYVFQWLRNQFQMEP